MHVISRKILREFCEAHADACDALYDWYRVATKAEWGIQLKKSTLNTF